MPRDTVASCVTEDSTPDAWRARGRGGELLDLGTMPAWTRGPFGTDGASRGGTTCRPTPDSSLPGSAGVISPRCDPSDRRADAAPSRSPATAESRTDHDAQFVCRRRRSSSAGFSDWSTAGTRRKRAPSPVVPRPAWSPVPHGTIRSLHRAWRMSWVESPSRVELSLWEM